MNNPTPTQEPERIESINNCVCLKCTGTPEQIREMFSSNLIFTSLVSSEKTLTWLEPKGQK